MSKADIEERLLTKARDFNLDALAEIYDSYSPGLFRYAMRLLSNEDLAEDCVAETFSRFLQTLRNGGGPNDHLQAYLYRIAHNWITDHYRRQPLPELIDNIDQQADDGQSPTGAVVEQQEREQVRAALLHLTPEQRQVIVLKFYKGWSNAEIAESIGKPVGAVKSLQHRALASLQRTLLKNGD